MDKKLILTIEKMKIETKSSKVSNSYEDLKRDIKYLPRILKVFEKIDIDEININNNNFSMMFENDFIYLDNKFVNIASKMDVVSNQVIFDLYSLYLKDMQIAFDGKFKIDYFTQNLNFHGNYFYDKLEGKINLDMNSKLAKFYLSSKPFESLDFLKRVFRLPPVAEAWMYDNVVGNIQLDNLYGEFDLEKKELLGESLKGKAQILNAQIKYHKDLVPILTKNLEITFEDNRLSFMLIEPKYLNADIAGSSVVINNLTSAKDGEVVVNIKTKSALDKTILDILKAYKINLPVFQKSGITDGDLLMTFPYDVQKNMDIKGKFLVENSDLLINKFAFSSKQATVLLDNSIIKIVDSDFKFKDMISAIVNLELDTKSLIAKGEAKINSVKITKNKKENIVDIQNITTPLNMNFNKNMKIELDKLNISVENSDVLTVKLNDLNKIYKYSKLLQDFSIKEGELSIGIENEDNIKLRANLNNLQNIPLFRNDVKIDSLSIMGNLKGKDLYLTTIQDDINFSLNSKNEISLYLKNLTFVVPSSNDGKKTKIPKLNFRANNLKIKTDEKTSYDFENLTASLNENISFFDAKLKELTLPISKNGEKIRNLLLSGTYKDDVLSINSLDNKLALKVKDKNIDLNLKDYDIEHSTEKKGDEENDDRSIKVYGKNSNILINGKYKFLANKYEIHTTKNTKYVNLNYKKTSFTYKKTSNGKIDIFADDVSDEFINGIFGKQIFNGGKFLLLANGVEDNLNGKFIIQNTKVEDLAVLNNLLLFIHSSPALINPLLAVPSVVGMATNGGFNLTGYQIVDGFLEFNYDDKKEFMKINKLVTVGNGIDFNGSGTFDVNTKNLDTKIKLIFLKDYSKIVGMIPIVNFILLGDNKRVETEVNLFGEISNPKISTNLTKDTFSVPVNIATRVLSSPAKLLEFIQEINKNQNGKLDNKPMLKK